MEKKKKKRKKEKLPFDWKKKKNLYLKKEWNIFIHVLLSLECYTKKYHRLGGLNNKN